MQRRILFILFTFWAFMSYRLWMVEYAGQSLGAAVDIQVVWKKMLNAQDEAKLQIVDERTSKLLGALEWMPNVVRDMNGSRSSVEGMVEKVYEYTLDIRRGRLYAANSREDLIYDFHLSFSPFPENRWKSLQLGVQREVKEVNYAFAVNAQTTNDFMNLSVEIGDLQQNSDVPYTDLKEPEKLIETGFKLAGIPDIAASGATLIVKNLLKSKELQIPQLNFEIDLPRQAHIDLLPGVRSRVKVYRLDIPVVENMLIKVYVNIIGEILRVEIPEVLIDTISKTAKLNLPKSIVLRNQNFYGKLRRNP
jgi:hypothetical protein